MAKASREAKDAGLVDLGSSSGAEQGANAGDPPPAQDKTVKVAVSDYVQTKDEFVAAGGKVEDYGDYAAKRVQEAIAAGVTPRFGGQVALAVAKPGAAPPPGKFKVGEDCKFSVRGQMVKLSKGRVVDTAHFHIDWFQNAQAAGAKLEPIKG